MIKLTTWFPGSLVLLSLVAGCGGSSGSDSNGQPSTADVVASCNTTCNKEKTCNPQFASAINCDTICNPDNFTAKPGTGGSTSTSTSTCDYGKLKAAIDHCATVDCSQLVSCEQQASAICSSSSSGTGGTTGVGTGGTTAFGTGGTLGIANGGTTGDGAGGSTASTGGSGTGDPCAPCAKAEACCPALYTKLGQSTTTCSTFTKAACDAANAQTQSTLVQACTGIVSGGAAESVPACQ